jgi:mannose-6-phosphate isomerase-like protein (cupin superfamily)
MEIVNKPWGKFQVLSGNDKFWHKLITVRPSKRLSLQVHEWRDEFWKIESGIGTVRIGDDTFFAYAGKTFFIPRGTKHRIYNTGETTLTFTEIAMGDVREDDIVRLEDDFGRSA